MSVSDQNATARARRKAEARYSFRFDAAAYVLVNALLIGSGTSPLADFHGSYLSSVAGELVSRTVMTRRTGGLGGDWVDRETQKILDEEKK